MDIVQFTDFHFGNREAVFDWQALAQSLSQYLRQNCQNPVLIVSGDVTFKGSRDGYEEAQLFFEELLTNEVTEPSRILMCPGNHDIVDSSFNAFDRFSYSLRRDRQCLYQGKHYTIVSIDGVLFKLFNSSYHLNHRFGLIDSQAFSDDLSTHDGLKIAVSHHHILNMFREDTSAIRNAYDFLKYLEEQNFDYLLHGHQHASQSYYLGKNPIRAFSARSGNFQQTGYLNSINIYRNVDKDFHGVSIFPERSSSGIKLLEIDL